MIKMIYNIFTEQVILPLSDIVLKTTLWKTFKQWKILEKKEAKDLKKLENDGLEKILNYALKEVSYYNNLNISHASDVKKFLANFPILTKEILKKENLLAVESSNLVKRSSSGSSGVQSTVYMSKKEVSAIAAIQALWWSWAGYRFGNTVLQAGINPQRGVVKRLKDIVLRFKYVNAFSLSDKDILNLLEELKKSPRDHLIGYASSIYSMALVAQKYGVEGVKFHSVMSLGDKMFSHYKKVIEAQFSTKVFDTYGCSEGLMMAGECEAGKYHIMSPHVYIEILDDDNKEVKVGEIGHVVVTRLDAYAMPLIRYKLGDLAVKADPKTKCSCGRPFPLLEKVIGRETDVIYLPSGKYVTVHSFTGIFEYFSEIKQFQVIELEDGIIVRYIKDSGFNKLTLDNVRQKIHEQIDNKLKVLFKIETYIEPTASGKPCMVMSKEKAKIYLKDTKNIGV
ncbi:MAG: hypothetical protein COA44_00585 [Arcobacter sp.]|nr:MAG: hypothetical protein COA44_00585 [Arcobacter sp.]